MTVGCYDVQMVVHEQGKADTFEQVKFAHFSDCEAYKFKFQNMYLNHIEMYDETKVLQYIIVVEEMMRAIAWQLTRRLADPVPFSLALLRALKENSQLWNENAYLLGGKKWVQNSQPQAAAQSSSSAVDEARLTLQSHGLEAPMKRPRVHGPTEGVCRHFNTPKGCSYQSCAYSHVCSAIKKVGRQCNSQNHGAHVHDPDQEWPRSNQGKISKQFATSNRGRGKAQKGSAKGGGKFHKK